MKYLAILAYFNIATVRDAENLLGVHAFASNILVSPNDFSWLSGKEFAGRCEPQDTKYFATSFCKNCGSFLPWLGKTGKAVVVPAGTLNDEPNIKPMQNIFCGSKAK